MHKNSPCYPVRMLKSENYLSEYCLSIPHRIQQIKFEMMVIYMNKKYIIKITAGLTAIILTIAGAWYTAEAVKENHYISVSTSQQEKQVIVLDAGHGGVLLNIVHYQKIRNIKIPDFSLLYSFIILQNSRLF